MKLEIKTIPYTLDGLVPFQFDHFYGQEKDTRPPEQKLYLNDNNEVVLPSENIYAFLFSEKGGGCARSFEGRKGKEFIRVGMSHITIEPLLIPFLRNGKPIVFENFTDGIFKITEFAPTTKMAGGSYIKQDVRRRPILTTPWQLRFKIVLIANTLIEEDRLYNWFVRGGIEIGLGNYRPRFGRFTVKEPK
jgi:hypothetical protein